MKTVYEIITLQRDYGNRNDRKQARLKYTLDNMGVDNFKKELARRCGFPLEAAKPYTFTRRRDYYGWESNHEGNWYYTLFVENGRVADLDNAPLKTALLEIAQTKKANFRFTCNQNVIISDVAPENKNEINEILQRFGLIQHTDNAGAVRKSAIACVAFNTCPLALAEAQRYLPTLITKLEPILQQYGLEEDHISVRMTGCPNGCGRPYAAEIGLIGTAYGRYNLHIGGDREGTRLNKKYKENIDEAAILAELDSLLKLYSAKRKKDETFGDFVMNQNLAFIN